MASAFLLLEILNYRFSGRGWLQFGRCLAAVCGPARRSVGHHAPSVAVLPIQLCELCASCVAARAAAAAVCVCVCVDSCV
jgi:hypothetical protein